MASTKIHGHRGARGRKPENSLPAVAFALNCGAHGIEVDICISKDDIAVVHHDLYVSSKLARNTSNQWLQKTLPVRSLNWSDLSQLDIGRINPDHSYSDLYPYQAGADDIAIPRLEEFLGYVNAESDQVVFNIELKGSPYDSNLVPEPERYLEIIMAALAPYSISHRIFMQSFDWRLMKQAQSLDPQITIGLLTDQQADGDPRSPVANFPSRWSDDWDLADFDLSVPDMVKSFGANVWSCNYLDLTQESLARARQLGLGVYVWTVNDIADIQRMIEWEVDVITTDYPDRALSCLKDMQ